MPAERPLLIVPAPTDTIERALLSSGRPRFRFPPRDRQAERLEPRFEALRQAFQERRVGFETDPGGLIPERVIVIETIGDPGRFVSAARNVPGLEWLAEIELEEIPADEDFYLVNDADERTGDALPGKLFMVFSNHQALDQLLSLWQRYRAGEEQLGKNLQAWKGVFKHARDVRRWSVRDRLQESGVLADWRERLAAGQDTLRCEIELWYRGQRDARVGAEGRVAALIREANGSVVDTSVIDPICYHAVLAELPAAALRGVVGATEEIALVQCEDIQVFRPVGQSTVELEVGEAIADGDQLGAAPPAAEPVVALFDGLPLQEHRRLTGRLRVDDPDDFETGYQAAERRHGTAMASLIVNGDLGAAGEPLVTPLYVRPLLCPDPLDFHPVRSEQAPANVLFVDLVHRAVRRLFEGEGGEPPVAPSVQVVSFSVGLRNRPFFRELSPLARLLDWLAHKYQVLFVVSAGNHCEPLRLGVPRAHVTGRRDGIDPQALTLRAMANEARRRRLLSPAEAVNVLTVGAAHSDSSGPFQRAGCIDVFADTSLPSPVNAMGLGYGRSVKPDVLVTGGRTVLIENLQEPAEEGWFDVDRQRTRPGHRVASPGAQAGDLDAVVYTRGTSNAAALASRAAAQLAAMLDELRLGPGGELLGDPRRAVFLRTLLVHGASWGTAAECLEFLREGVGERPAEYTSRFLGFGLCRPDRVMECAANRVTALSGGALANEQGMVHRFPIPPSLDGVAGYRRFVVTLSWFSPLRDRPIAGWTNADLWFTEDEIVRKLQVRAVDVDVYTGRRGTVQHRVYEGSRAAVLPGDSIEIRVSCRSLDGRRLPAPVRYALAMTLEVAPELGIDVYDEVRARVQAALQVQP